MISLSTKKFSPYAPIVLRMGLAAVYVWFGVSQWANTKMWTGLVPAWATDIAGMSAVTIVHLNGVAEICGGFLLAIGVLVQPIAALLFIHLVVITSDLGVSAIGVRDFGLSIATLAIALFGEDMWCVSFKKQEVPQGQQDTISLNR